MGLNAFWVPVEDLLFTEKLPDFGLKQPFYRYSSGIVQVNNRYISRLLLSIGSMGSFETGLDFFTRERLYVCEAGLKKRSGLKTFRRLKSFKGL